MARAVRLRHGHRRRLATGLLELVVATVAAILLVGVIPELARLNEGGTPTESSGPGGTGAAGALGTRAPIMVAVGSDANCGACHVDANGGVGTKTIPPLAHPLEGWRDCTACHADDRLVKTAPGHSSLHKDDCLICHAAPILTGSAPPRPHHVVTGAPCISCHGSTAPLPTDMVGRTNCWICHYGTEFNGLFGSPSPSVGPAPS